MRKNSLILGAVAASLTLTGFAAPTFAARQKPTPEQRAEWAIKRFDTNGDGKVSLDEVHVRTAEAFKTFDADGNGQVTREEIKAQRKAHGQAWRAAKEKTGADKTAAMDKLKEARPAMLPGVRQKGFKRADTDKNGSLSLTEVTARADAMFKRRDTNGDGVIDAADFNKTRKI
ncbi:EF-hand domain-containing protein [Rhizobium sp. Root483D2]|uniref:EF-hand domain-containing protein n=1 Tax=Rhizobium sp. Root483D2 TaxID=1736545 RepID=UPI000712445A|nr:EF-hand domain-containing protein [Rhizobium sp. Root483D2]KQY41814.1 hypothetical protein ASD32_15650 [Rhizobium sp. Root483D2]